MSESNPTGRLRQPPPDRFAAPALQFELREVAAELAAEPSAAPHGHRQKTLYRHERVTVALFIFEAGSSLPHHTAAGTVTINVLDGRLKIRTPSAEHDLTGGRLLVLASGVPHDVIAEQRSTMLLQVHLDQPLKD